MSSDSRAVKGLNIAIIVLAALSLLASLFLVFGAGLLSACATDPSVVQNFKYEYYYDNTYGSNLTTDDVTGVLLGLGAVLMVYSIFVVPASILALIAGILGVRNAAKPDKLGAAFVLTILAIILNVLCFQLITFILLIISAVFISKVRKSAVAIPYAANSAAPGAYQQQAYTQPVRQASATPQQPAAPVPSTTPEQPGEQQNNNSQ